MLSKPFGEVKEDFRAGELNDWWRDIECLKLVMESPEAMEKLSGSWMSSALIRDYIRTELSSFGKVREALIKYTHCRPWPPEVYEDPYTPEFFTCRFFGEEYREFNYLAGFARGMLIPLDSDTYRAFYARTEDIESAITANCLRRYAKVMAERAERDRLDAEVVSAYLLQHVGENPTRKKMSLDLGIPVANINKVIGALKHKGRLEFDSKHYIVRFDAE